LNEYTIPEIVLGTTVPLKLNKRERNDPNIVCTYKLKKIK
jgi:hypothetical protein